MKRLPASMHVLGDAIRNRRIAPVLLAFFLFNVAEWGRWVALLVYAFKEGGPVKVGLITITQLGPAALLTPFSSVLADRYPRTRVLRAAYLAAAVGDILAGAALLAGMPFPVVVVLATLGIIGITLVRPTQTSLLPSLVDSPEELTAANVASSIILGSALLLGPFLAAGILAAATPSLVLLVTGSCLASGGAIVWWAFRGVTTEASSTSFDVAAGVRELRRNRGAALLVILSSLHALIWGMADVLIVTLAIRELDLGPSGPGLLSGMIGIGGLAGAAAAVVLVGRRRLIPAFSLGVLLWSLPLLGIAALLLPLPVAVMLAVAGAGFTVLDVAARTLLQRAVPDELLGRVFGVLEATFMAGWGLGAVLAPRLLDDLGLRWTFVVAGLLLPVVVALTWSPLSELDRDVPLPGTELELLRRIEMFAPLSEPVLERMARNLMHVSADIGDVIVRQGDTGDLVYLIEEGMVSVATDGEEVARFGAGDYFGEVALLRDVPRTATVTALTSVRLLSLDRAPFLRALTGTESAITAAHAAVDRRMTATPPGGPSLRPD